VTFCIARLENMEAWTRFTDSP